MADEIIKELWKIKDAVAQEHHYDVDALIAYLKKRQTTECRQVVDLCARKKTIRQSRSADKTADA